KGWKELLELIDKIRTRVGRELKQPVEVVSCYEAGYDGFWVHRLLEENGVRNYVIDPASLQVDRRARRVKTDNVDVTKLLRSLMAYLRGEPKVWSVVRVPTVAEEDDRRLHRERDRLINERVQHVNRIKGLCAVHGVYHYEPLRSDRMKRLEQLRTGDERELPPRAQGCARAEIAPTETGAEDNKTNQKRAKCHGPRRGATTVRKCQKGSAARKDGEQRPENCPRAGRGSFLPPVQQPPAGRQLRG